jgi:hypothetical protein
MLLKELNSGKMLEFVTGNPEQIEPGKSTISKMIYLHYFIKYYRKKPTQILLIFFKNQKGKYFLWSNFSEEKFN